MLPSFLRIIIGLSSLGVVVRATNLNREIILAPQAGATREDLDIRRRQERLSSTEGRADDYEQLGWAFVAKARRTLDAGYYKLAEKTADVMDARFGGNERSQLLRGHVMHNLHRFADAEMIARQLVERGGGPEALALLSDTLMEQGKLGEAIGALQQMINLKPGLEADTRVAHLRWLKGDLPGAILAMENAARAISPQNEENRAWVLSRLSGFYLQSRELQRALLTAESAAQAASSYPPALLASGRALWALGRNDAAIGILRRAAELNPLPEYQWWLADVLRDTGNTDEAVTVEKALNAHAEATDPRTYALYLASRGERVAVALRLARDDLTQRADVFSHDALAWAHAASGQPEAAAAEIEAALAEGTKDARLYFHGGEIELSRGRLDEARKYFAKARALENSLTPSERTWLDLRLTALAGETAAGETSAANAKSLSEIPKPPTVANSQPRSGETFFQ